MQWYVGELCASPDTDAANIAIALPCQDAPFDAMFGLIVGGKLVQI
jgi:hypothetical protein